MFMRDLEYGCDGCGCEVGFIEDGAARDGEWVIAICDGCGMHRWTPSFHFAPRLRDTVCGRALNGEHRMVTQIPTEVDCLECQFVMIAEMAVAPTPDWRPPFPIAEDDYA
jgi:hypothetical protein